MASARTVIAEATEVVRQAEDAIRNHPFAVSVAAGSAPLEALQAFCGAQYCMWQRSTGDISVSWLRFKDHPFRDVFLVAPEVEKSAAQEFATLGQKLGMNQVALDRYEPSAEAFAYAAYRAWLICYGSASEIACARAFNLTAWGENCALISNGLRTHYGLDGSDTRFLDGFSGLSALEDKAAKIIDIDLDAGVDPDTMVRAARLMQSYELMFWDAMAAETAV